MTYNPLLSISTLLLLIFPSSLQGQSNRFKSIQTSSFDIVLGGDFGYRLIDGNTNDSNVAEAIGNRERFENYKFNYRFGFNYYQGIGESLLIKTGVRLANPGFTTGFIEPIDVQQNINEINKTHQPKGIIYQYAYQIVEIPIGLRQIISWSLCKPYIEFGVAPNI